MALEAPKIDKRNAAEIVAEVEAWLRGETGWNPPEADAAAALIRIFARFAELVIERLNQVPEKSFLAFLDLLGLSLEPPQPARVPLSFQLAAGSPADALVPAGTPVAATPLEGEVEPPVFATERDLVVTRSRLVAAWTREPGRDLYRDGTTVAKGEQAGSFHPFEGKKATAHRLYLGHASLLTRPARKTVTLRLTPAASWPALVDWDYWDGILWRPLAASYDKTAGEVRLDPLPALPESTAAQALAESFKPEALDRLDGAASAWLRGRLTTPLPRGDVVEEENGREYVRHGVAPTTGRVETEDALFTALDFSQPFQPFGESFPPGTFYLAAGDELAKPGTAVEVTVEVDRSRPASPAPDLELAWEYPGEGAWQPLAELTDETSHLTEDGTLSFTAADDWRPAKVDGVRGLWLRARRAAGGYGSGEEYHPPVLAGLSLGYRWPLPRIEGVEVSVSITSPEPLAPDLGFSNQSPLDISKDFLPLGDKPKIGDAFYLDDAAFSRPTARVTISVELTPLPDPPSPSSKLVLAWELWDGQEWSRVGESGPGTDPDADHGFGFEDATEGLVKGDNVSFDCPPCVAAREVNGETGHWLRVRIAGGNYGVEARYEPLEDPAAPGTPIPHPETGLPIYQLIPATFRPPSLRSLRLSYHYDSQDDDSQPAGPDHVFSENDYRIAAHTAGESFYPFTPPAEDRPALHLGFERPGDEVGFANRATALYFGLAEAPYRRFTAGRTVDEEAAVVWEYWNGTKWRRLGTRDETSSFRRRGLVSFIGPPDFRAAADFGRRAFWLRGRWESGEYAAPPRLARVFTNTMWASHAETLEGEVLGSSRGEPGQSFRANRTPVLAGQKLEVREPETPPAAELAELAAEEGGAAVTTVRDASGRPLEVWVRWHEVPDFHASGTRHRHYTLERLSGEVRFGDGRRGLVPPPGRANVRLARYRTGGGQAGNRDAGTLTELKGAVPYVDAVTNPEPAAGGAERESLEMVRIRGPKSLRHRGRAVAVADFEDLAYQASNRVARAHGIAAPASEPGSVGLIIVPRGTEAQPIPSLELLDRVRNDVEARLQPTVDLWLAGPDWLEVTVDAEVALEPVRLEESSDVHNAILERLADFLHPLTGGASGGGWELGRKPQRSDFYALIEATPGVDHVRRLAVTEKPEEQGVRPGRFLVHSGAHRIVMTGAADEESAS